MARTKQAGRKAPQPEDRRPPDHPAGILSSPITAELEMETEEENQYHGSSPTKNSGKKSKNRGLSKTETRTKLEEDYSKQLDLLQRDIDQVTVDDQMEAARLRANHLKRLAALLQRKTEIEKKILDCMHYVQEDYDASVHMLNYLTSKRAGELAAVEDNGEDEEETSSDEDAEKDTEGEHVQGEGDVEDRGMGHKAEKYNMQKLDPKLRGGDASVALERKKNAEQARSEDLVAEVNTARRMAAASGRDLPFGSRVTQEPADEPAVARVENRAGRRGKIIVEIPVLKPPSDHPDASPHHNTHKRKHRHYSDQAEGPESPKEKENRAWRASQVRSVDTDKLRANQTKRDAEKQEEFERKRAERSALVTWGDAEGLEQFLGEALGAGTYADTDMDEGEDEVEVQEEEIPSEKRDRKKKRKHVAWEEAGYR